MFSFHEFEKVLEQKFRTQFQVMLCQELGNSEEETEDVKNKLQEAKADISRYFFLIFILI